MFGKKWIAYQGIDVNNPDAKSGMGAIMGGSFILMAVATIALAVLVERLQLTQAISGVKLGLFTGLFFSATAISITYLYIKKPLGLHFIDGGYHIVGQIVAAIILCVWR